MRIRTGEFCALATAPTWQGWLYHFDNELYRYFITRLRNNNGCHQNKELMIEILNKIDNMPDGNDKLLNFLSLHHRHILVDDNIFPDYIPGILTYPHRHIIIDNDFEALQNKVKLFLSDKLKHDSLIIGSKAYIEYLTLAEEKIIAQIPNSSWLINKWRIGHKK